MRHLLFFVFISLAFVSKTRSAHIVGGTITYECVGFNADSSYVTFLLECQLYRDAVSLGAQFDPFAEFGVYRLDNSGWSFVESQSVPLGQVEDVEYIDDPCVEEPVGAVQVEYGVYRREVTLEVTDKTYMVAYQRCCRNQTISNIYDPGGTGIAISVEITPEAQQSCNNSPAWNFFPPIFICNHISLDIDHTATDAEGDSLVYRFCPLTSAGGDGNAGGQCNTPTPNAAACLPPFDQVNFIAPNYSSQFPLGGSPLVTIGLNSGIIVGKPNVLGQFSVGVCVEEYRNGIQIGEIRRDFQFNVLDCPPLVNANLTATEVLDESNFYIQSCGKNEVFFKNKSTNANFIQSYEWVFDINGTFEMYDTRDVTVEFPGIGQYTGTLIINKGLPCSDTAHVSVGVFPAIDGDFEFQYDTCVTGPVYYTDLSSTGADNLIAWDWDFGEGTGETQNTSFLFSTPGSKVSRLIVTDSNECMDTVTKIVSYFPAPTTVIVEPNAFVGCAPANITFDNLTVPIDSTYSVSWDFGDGGGSTDLSPTHEFHQSGNYSIELKIISPLGCEATANFDNWISIREGPIADYTYSPEELNSLNKIVQFTDESTDAVSWQWNFGNYGFSQIQNPTYEFPDTGSYEIQLVSFHESGCTDTMIRTIDVVPLNTFYFPNAFTPNFDGNNETFRGKGLVVGVKDFSLSVWNRWGEQVFEIDDPTIGWDGRERNTGNPAPGGVYVYRYSFTDARNNIVKDKGQVVLIR